MSIINTPIDRKLVAKYSRPAPRYTSYPTAPAWRNSFSAQDHIEHLSGEKLSLYIHIPFCEKKCLFCGCSSIATTKKEVAKRYIEIVAKEIGIVSKVTGGGNAVQLHLGGGTPNYLHPEELAFLMGAVRSAFELRKDCEISCELDPRSLTSGYLSTLKELGFNRISLGVQDTNDSVQRGIGRIEPLSHLKELMAGSRSLGFSGINCDIIYGLPLQTVDGFIKTVNDIISLSPDRIACFNFAFLPKVLSNQQSIAGLRFPDINEKFEMFQRTVEQFESAGYSFIGLDHFAKREDPISKAANQKKLRRNFQGYTTEKGATLIGFGLTAISEFSNAYAQNSKKLAEYYRLIEEGKPATVKGHSLSKEDIIRKEIIQDIFCNQRADISQISPPKELEELQNDGLIEISGDIINITRLGRFFLRNIALPFDTHINDTRTTFSKT